MSGAGIRRIFGAVVAAALVAVPMARAATPAQPPAFVTPPGTAGFSVANYDFNDPSVGTNNADWPVNLIFTGRATVAKVKAALGRTFPWPGSIEWGVPRTTAGITLPDPDAGRKSRLCSLLAPSVHYRLYAPLGTSFPSTVLGSYVVGTAHLDLGECGRAPVFGWSEDAEARVAHVAQALGWRIGPSIPMLNPEPDRWEGPPTERFPGNHFWQSDGLATQVVVP